MIEDKAALATLQNDRTFSKVRAMVDDNRNASGSRSRWSRVCQ